MKYLLSMLLFVAFTSNAQTKPKVVTECTIDYTVAMGDGSTSAVQSTSLVLYIKGQQSRLDFISPSFKQVKYYDGKSRSAVILQDLGATKVRRDLDSMKWKKLNEKYDSLVISYNEDRKTILGYECRKATITLKNGATYTLFYAVDIIPSTIESEFQFRGIPGFVLEYEAAGEGSGQKVTYTATKINLSPVSPTKFEIPKSGYRVL